MTNEAYMMFGGEMVFLPLEKVVDLAHTAETIRVVESDGRSTTFRLWAETDRGTASTIEVHAEGRAEKVLSAYAVADEMHSAPRAGG